MTLLPQLERELLGAHGRRYDPDRRSRASRLLGAGGIAVTASVAVAVAVLVILTAGQSHPSASHRFVSRPRLVKVESILPRFGAVAMLVSHGSLWVAGQTSIARVDPRTGRVLARIRVPSGGVGSGQLAAGAGSVWAAYTGTPDVLRIDPATNRVTAQISVPDGGGVAFADGHVWITRVSSHRGDVVAIDPRTNRLTGRPVKVGTGPLSLTSGFGSLWVDNTAGVYASRVYPQTRRMTHLPIEGTPYVGFGSVWVVTQQDFNQAAPLSRLNPRTGSVVATIHVPRLGGIAFGDGHVWAGTLQKSSSPRVNKPIPGTARLTEIDPHTDRIVGRPIRLPADASPDAIAIVGHDLWIADYDGLLHFKLRG